MALPTTTDTTAPGWLALPSNETLDAALDKLQATATAFAESCIRDSRVREQYMRDVREARREILDDVHGGRSSEYAGAVRANAIRNDILDASRMRNHPIGRAWATQLKAKGLTLGELETTYAARRFSRAFGTLSEPEQAVVYLDIIEASGRARPAASLLAVRFGRVGRRLAVVSLAIAVYEIYESDNRPREAAHQGVLAGAGIAGSIGFGAAAVGLGVCAATAPICVAVAAFVGAVLVSEGADLAWGSIYPAPAHHR